MSLGHEQKTYLGDGVYAEFDGYHVWIYASNGIEDTEPVALEPAVVKSLTDFYDRMWRKDDERTTTD